MVFFKLRKKAQDRLQNNVLNNFAFIENSNNSFLSK